jgi:hypothetical protein
LILPFQGGAGLRRCYRRSTFTFFAAKTFEIGREKLDIGGGAIVGLYSAERSLVDSIRLRHREGSDVAWEALRWWLRRRGSKPAALLKMAKHFYGAERAIRNALEIVL